MARQAPLRKIKAETAAEVCAHFELDKEERPLLTPGATPRELLDALAAAGKRRAAIRFLAHALPHREAVWWGCLCLKQAFPAGMPGPEEAAVKTAVLWVLEPTEAARKAAADSVEAAGKTTPGGGVAWAVSLTGGSLSPTIPKVPPVPPGPYLPAKALVGAILLASTKTPNLEDAQRLFVELGTGVAEGRYVWPEGKPEPPKKKWGG